MSCDYAVWHTESRLTDAQAIELYAKLCDGDSSGVSPSDAIAKFYIELTSLHPEIDSVPDDRIDDHDLCPWSIAFDRSDGHLIMCCVWSRAEYVGDLVRRLARKHRLSFFDPQTGTIIHPGVLKLTADGERRRMSPSLVDLNALVDRMASGTGPSFAILEGRGDDYVQVFGAGDAFTVEWREHAGNSFRHWKAGSFASPSGNTVSVVVGDRKLSVESNERLAAADVAAILEAYLNGSMRPEQYEWRDMTDMFRTR